MEVGEVGNPFAVGRRRLEACGRARWQRQAATCPGADQAAVRRRVADGL